MEVEKKKIYDQSPAGSDLYIDYVLQNGVFGIGDTLDCAEFFIPENPDLEKDKEIENLPGLYNVRLMAYYMKRAMEAGPDVMQEPLPEVVAKDEELIQWASGLKTTYEAFRKEFVVLVALRYHHKRGLSVSPATRQRLKKHDRTGLTVDTAIAVDETLPGYAEEPGSPRKASRIRDFPCTDDGEIMATQEMPMPSLDD